MLNLNCVHGPRFQSQSAHAFVFTIDVLFVIELKVKY